MTEKDNNIPNPHGEPTDAETQAQAMEGTNTPNAEAAAGNDISAQPQEEDGLSPREGYHGVGEATATTASFFGFGALGLMVGRFIGLFSMKSTEKQMKFIFTGVEKGGMGMNVIGWAMAAGFGILGAYGASRQARAGSEQVHDLQGNVNALEAQNMALKAELKSQLRGEGTLSHFNVAWERSGKEDETISADELRTAMNGVMSGKAPTTLGLDEKEEEKKGAGWNEPNVWEGPGHGTDNPPHGEDGPNHGTKTPRDEAEEQLAAALADKQEGKAAEATPAAKDESPSTVIDPATLQRDGVQQEASAELRV